MVFPKFWAPAPGQFPLPGCLPPSQLIQGYWFAQLCLALMGFLLSSSWTVCSCLEHSSIRTSAFGELHQETPVPALRSNPLQSQNVGRKLMVQPWPFSRICERDRLLLCLKGGFISPWEKEAYFMSFWNMMSRKAPDGLQSPIFLQRPLSTPWYNKSCTLNKACFGKV